MRKVAAAFTTAICLGVTLPAAPAATTGNPVVATVAFGSPITDGTSPVAGAIALDTRTRRAFIIGGTANQLAMFDTDSGRLLHLFSMGTSANSIDVDAGIGRVLVAVGAGSSKAKHDAVLVLDARNGRVLHRTSVGPSPYSVGLDPARHHLFVETSDTNGYHASLSTVDTITGHVLRRELMGPSPSLLGLDQTHGRLFIETTDPNDYSGAISTLDTARGQILHSVPFGPRPMPVGPPQVVIDTVRDRIFVTRIEASATSDDIVLAAIEARHGRLLHKVILSTDAGFPAQVIEDRRTGRVFASSAAGVLVLDAHSGAVLTRAAIEPAAGAMALDAQTDQVFVGDSKGITIFDARSGQQRRTVLPGTHISDLVLDTRTRRIVGSGPDTLILLDARTDRLLQAPNVFGNDLTLTAVAGLYLITQNAGPTTFVRVFDPATGAVGPPIDLGSLYDVDTVDQRRQRVFVTKAGTVQDNIYYDSDGAVGVLDARTGIMQDVVREGSYPENVTVAPRSGAAFITDGLDDTATAFAPTFGRPGSSPQHSLSAKPSFPHALPLLGSDVVVDERSGNAFVAIQTSAGGTANPPIGMIAGATGQLVHASVLGAYAGQPVDDPATGRMYVPVTNPNSLCILDAHTGRLVDRVPLPGPPGAIAFDPAEGHAIIAIAARTSGQPGRIALFDTHHTMRLSRRYSASASIHKPSASMREQSGFL